MKKKRIVTMLTAAGLVLSAAFTSFAGQWVYDGPESYQWRYQEDDGSCPVNAWKEVDGKWYHFDENGYLDLGCQYIEEDEKWYWFDESGAMLTEGRWEGGHIEPDGSLFLHYPFLTLNEDGQEALYYEDGYGENYYGTSEWRKNVYKTMLEYFQAQKAGQNTTFSLNIQVPENWWLEMPEPMFEMLIVGAMGQTGYDTRSISDYSYFTEGTNLHLELTITPNV